nr:hypothetical protein [Vogesella sp.]
NTEFIIGGGIYRIDIYKKDISRCMFLLSIPGVRPATMAGFSCRSPRSHKKSQPAQTGWLW